MEIPPNSVLFWSGGRRSTRLLRELRKQPVYFDIVQIRDFWTKEQRASCDELIMKWKLKVFSYPPADRYFIGSTMVDEFAVPEGVLPILRTITDGDGCLADLSKDRMPAAPFKWSTVLLGNAPVERRVSGNTEFWCPTWTPRNAAEIGLKANERFACCFNCLKDEPEVWCHLENDFIHPINWDKDANAAHYEQIYRR
jgi:hypothetical protein